MRFSWQGLALSAFFMGLMFNTRYQMGFVIVAVALWMLLIQKTPFRQLVLFSVVVLATVAFGVLLDSIGYGEFELVPWNYLQVNLIEGRAATFGTDPWYFYVLSMLIQPVGPGAPGGSISILAQIPKERHNVVHVVFCHGAHGIKPQRDTFSDSGHTIDPCCIYFCNTGAVVFRE